MASLLNVQDGFQNVANAIGENPLLAVGIAAGVGGVIGAGTSLLVSKKSTKKKRKKSKARSSRKRTARSKDWRYISKQKHEQAYQRRRKKLGKKTRGKRYKTKRYSSKGIKYTKNGQPYKILSNGRARFIKKRGKR
jgi:hypothetical protein